jgi:hypothetical protein
VDEENVTGIRHPLHHPPLGIGCRVGCSLIHGKGSDSSQGRVGAHAAEVQGPPGSSTRQAVRTRRAPYFFPKTE